MRGYPVSGAGERVLADRQSNASRAQFTDWVSPHWEAMVRCARRLAGTGDWEEVLQESLSVAWRKRDKFDEARGSARAWLLALTADQARKAARRKRASEPLPLAAAPSGPSPDDRIDIHAALTTLSTKHRLAIELYYFVDLPISEVAAAMGCKEGTVKSTLADARTRMRAKLERPT